MSVPLLSRLLALPLLLLGLLALPHHRATAQAAPGMTSMPAAPANLLWRKLPLLYAPPREILRLMHWGEESPPVPFILTSPAKTVPRNPNLPDGVETIYALQSDNSLLIEATPEGFAKVKEIVAPLDVAPRTVRIKVTFIIPTAKDSEVQGLDSQSGKAATDLFTTLTERGDKTVVAPLVAVADDATANVTLPESIFSQLLGEAHANQYNGPMPSITVGPRLNSDETVTLNVQMWGFSALAPTHPSQDITPQRDILRTVRSGETMVLAYPAPGLTPVPSLKAPIVSGFFRNFQEHKTPSLLVFLTPTVLPAETPKATAQTTSTPRTIQVHWQMVDVPEGDWKKLEGIGDKDKFLAALAQGNYKTISSPTVTTTDGVQATVKVETKVPYGPKQDFLTVGQSTTVTPRVNTDGTITVQVTATNSEVSGPPAEANGAPPTTSQSLSITRTAKSGETVIGGGLSQKTPTGDILRLILLTPSLVSTGTALGQGQVKKQVQIQAYVVTADTADVEKQGIAFDLVPYPEMLLAARTSASPQTVSPETTLRYATGHKVRGLFDALAEQNGVTLAALLTTSDNAPASVRNYHAVPYSTIGNPTGGVHSAPVKQWNFLEINNGFTVTPRINTDNTITMKLSVEQSDLADPTSPSGGPPPTTTQILTTLRTARNGDTIVLGGLTRRTKTVEKGGVAQNREMEVLLFLTPTILATGSEKIAPYPPILGEPKKQDFGGGMAHCSLKGELLPCLA